VAAHEPAARRAGVTDGQLAALRLPAAAGAPAIPALQRAVLRSADASTREVTVAGYAMVSRFLVALQVPLPAGSVGG
jgi:4-carboxymuconolactone decarboxylase